jgi:ATP-dependent Lhr-like helicase
MVFETRPGDRIILGASTWAVESIGRDRVVVSPAPGEPGRVPFWHGDSVGRPVELGRALGAFTREIGQCSNDSRAAYIQANAPLNDHAAQNLATYVRDQLALTGTLPTDRAITVERFRDELGDW